MKIQKIASGKNIVKISRRDWLKIGKKAGWIKKKAQQEYDLESLYDQYKMSKPTEGQQKKWYVSVYEISRGYGGPEEGGWWYDMYELSSTKQMPGEEAAREFAVALNEGIETKGLNDESLGSSRGMDLYPDPSGGDPMYDHSDNDIPLGFSGLARNYRAIVENYPGEHEETDRPRYE